MAMLKECKINECQKIAKDALEGTRKRGRPRKGWMGGVEED